MAPMGEAPARRMRSILAIAVSVVGALLAGSWALHRCAENKRAVKPALSKPAGVARAVPTAASAEEAPGGFVGVSLSRQSVQIAPKFEGPLASVKVRMGDEVQQGEVIAVLDTAALRKELAVAEAVVLAAQSDERKARAELEEQSPLP